MKKKKVPTEIWFIVGGLLLFLALFGATRLLNRYILHIVILIGIYSIATVSLNLTNGYTGLFSLGHAAFMAVGAYTSTLLTFPLTLRKAYELPLLPSLLGGPEAAWPFLPALIAGGLMASFCAILIGAPVLRLRGHYLSVASLGFMVIVVTLAKTLRGITRGSMGINAIPSYTNIYWTYLWLLVTIYVVWRVVNSRFGRAMIAIREDEVAAQVLGIYPMKYKLLSFVIGAFFAGVAGGLYAHFTKAIRPFEFSFFLTFQIVVMLIIGGMGTMSGPVVGAASLIALRYALKPVEEHFKLYGFIELVYAILLIVIMLWKPEGIMGKRLKR
ncbi:MAG: branched-chain amino acid transport system permease protein [Candidatus Atribacteria bacterium]|jgi:branched-chain amino acid transport system permease protein|uniref:branched-chain amino acid ABC transporter permease n=1 Tax=Atrimonas thermophila TaxID=3064161 RepID=UPI0024AAFFD7|nr:branched-chain amino acid transport system permease protein [Candidatus Atribacteria bacterium]MDI3531223.1 branched-chain amino acid transport system permease protein [Candidatus Atribacteria bacterium]